MKPKYNFNLKYYSRGAFNMERIGFILCLVIIKGICTDDHDQKHLPNEKYDNSAVGRTSCCKSQPSYPSGAAKAVTLLDDEENMDPCGKKSVPPKVETTTVRFPGKKCPEGKRCICKSCCLSSCRAGVRKRCENCSAKIVTLLQKRCTVRCEIPQKKFIEPPWSFYKAVSFLKFCEENPTKDFCLFLKFTATSKCEVTELKQTCNVNKCCQ